MINFVTIILFRDRKRMFHCARTLNGVIFVPIERPLEVSEQFTLFYEKPAPASLKLSES